MDAATQTAINPKANVPPKLEDQAATAALYVTNAHKQPKSSFPLDADNKLSSAGAATSLRYASPRDLPSFPTVGVTNTESSAGAAASLANASHKSFEYWKPESSAPASKAAILAKDYKPAPLWHPEMSAAGSKAALIAANHGGNVEIWRPEATKAGNSAAGQAMRNKTLSPQIDYGYTADGTSKALMAATGAMSGRKRSGSSPTVASLYPDSANSAANALNAATVANRPSTKQPGLGSSGSYGLSSKEATRIHNAAITNLGREMYTSHPPVAPEVEEKKRQDSLRAAAISMAKQMYDVQQKILESAAGVQRSDSHHAANSVHGRPLSVSSTTEDSVRVPPQYPNLQQAAQKLAAERLAKLGQDEDAAYRDYYGAHAPIQSRLSVRGRLRRRASSDSAIPESDEARSQQIRSQMSIFNDKLAQVDAKKRQKDRESLLAAAQRNVAARMHGLDEKVFAETGKVSPAMASEWETKARARAEADSSARMANHGKVNIGGGKYMDQSEVEAIAAARVQPTLDEITEKAEAQRAKDEQLRQEAEERRRIAEEKAQYERERSNKTKDEWRRFKDEEKREQRAKKDEEKAKKAEEKRLRDEEKRKSKTLPVSEKLGAEVKDTEDETAKSSFTPLDPIPKLEPITADNATTTTTGPLIVPSSPEDVETTTTKIEPILIEDAENTELKTLSNKVEIAKRVFSAPVINDSDTRTLPPLGSEELQTDAVGDKPTEPSAKPTPKSTAESTTEPTAEPNPTTSANESSGRATSVEPVSARIAIPTSIETSTKDTTSKDPSSPPSSPTKAESGKGLSSWLKTKLLRSGKSKVTKPAPEAPLDNSEPTSTTPAKPSSTDNEVIAPVETADTSTTPGASSAREVAMAGRDSLEQTQSHPTALTSHPVVSRSRSTSISSLSSDEPTTATDAAAAPSTEERGRSRSLRLARTGSTDDGYGDGYVVRAHGSEEIEGDAAADESGEEEFGDARELPLPSFVREGEARLGESPVRDSRFVEDL